MYVLAILPEVRLPGLHIQLPRGQKELPRRLTELFLPDVKLKIPGWNGCVAKGFATPFFSFFC